MSKLNQTIYLDVIEIENLKIVGNLLLFRLYSTQPVGRNIKPKLSAEKLDIFQPKPKHKKEKN